MSIRKCIYTGKDAESKDNVLPKKFIGDEIHNWANQAPCSAEYKNIKQDRLPSELELQANELFRLLELAKIRVKHYELKIEEIQQELGQNTQKTEEKEPKKNKLTKKLKEEKTMIHEKKIIEEVDFDKIIDERKKDIWK